MLMIECIAFMLITSDQILVEKRKLTKRLLPGVIALPGGHMETNETPEETLYREMKEEVGIVPTDTRYVCTLLHRSQEFRKLHYFAVTCWTGEIISHEAECVFWIPLNALDVLDPVDRTAVQEYIRVYTT